MAKNQSALEFDLEYCSSWGGKPEADYTAKILKIVYPNANVKVHSPGHTANLVINLGGKEIFNKKKGDGSVNTKTAVKFLEKVKTLVNWKNWKLKKRKKA